MKFTYIKADSFFRDYLPHIKSYKHKIRGKNGRGNLISFSDQENAEIKAAIKAMLKDIVNSDNNKDKRQSLFVQGVSAFKGETEIDRIEREYPCTFHDDDIINL